MDYYVINAGVSPAFMFKILWTDRSFFSSNCVQYMVVMQSSLIQLFLFSGPVHRETWSDGLAVIDMSLIYCFVRRPVCDWFITIEVLL